MQDLMVTSIQTSLHWEDIDANIRMLDKKLDNIKDKTHLVILPEMFSTGFSMNAAAMAREMDGAAVAWIQQKSAEKGFDIAGSLMVKEKGHFYNRLVWAKPDGRFYTCDKKHLFRFAGEEKVYTPGTKKLTVTLNGWKIRPFVCYDLRFPVWTRNIDKAYDIAIFVANWPRKRSAHWRALLLARAIENQCYVIGVNRVGIDGNGFAYSGDSSVIDPKGTLVFHQADNEVVHTSGLSFDLLEAYRKEFPAWMDADAEVATPATST